MNDIENSMVLNLGAPPGWEPDPVLCACGKAEPLDGYDDTAEELVAFYLDHRDELEDARMNPRLQSPAELDVYARADAAITSGYQCTFCTRPAEVYGADPRSRCCHAVARRAVPHWRVA